MKTISETMVFWLVLCLGVAILAYVMRSMPVSIVSSIGFCVASFQIYEEEADMFILAMLWMIAFTLPFAVERKRTR